jgi:hypothetical protein
MTMQRIPFTSDPNATFTASIDGVDYQFDTLYNERASVWTFDLSLAKTGAPLVTGVPILLGCDLLAPYGLDIGSLYAVDLTAAAQREQAGHRSQPVDAGPEDLGVRVMVVYLAPGEVLP